MTPHAPSNPIDLLSSALPLADARWFRPAASTTAHHVDELFMLITWISVFFFVLVIGLMFWFMWIYRKRKGHREQHSQHHNNTLEVAWSVIPLLLVIGIFYKGFTGYIDMRNPPDNAYVIEVEASKWQWNFKYPNGATDAVLHVPAGTPVKLILSSKDVLHSLYIPAFRIKMDCVPGRYTDLWFEATTPSKDATDEVFDKNGYDLFCAEYCGTGHSSMVTKCVVHPKECYQKKLDELADVRKQGDPVEVGEKLYNQRGCAQCHTIDGTDRPGPGGPSFKGHFDKEVRIKGGQTVKMDDSYIRESILEPQAKIRDGFNPIMPTFQGQLNDDQIYAIRQYIRSLNGADTAEWEPLKEDPNAEPSVEVEKPDTDSPEADCGYLVPKEEEATEPEAAAKKNDSPANKPTEEAKPEEPAAKPEEDKPSEEATDSSNE